MTRPISATLSLASLTQNAAILKSAAEKKFLLGVVKANAYGHRLDMVFPALWQSYQAGYLDGLAVVEFSEALLLRTLGWVAPIVLLQGPFCRQDVSLCAAKNLQVVVHNDEQLAWIKEWSSKGSKQKEQRLQVWMKMNTGMNRLGFAPAAYKKAVEFLNGMSFVAHMGHFTHLSDADSSSKASNLKTQRQIALLLEKSGYWGGAKSFMNSAALLRSKERKDGVEGLEGIEGLESLKGIGRANGANGAINTKGKDEIVDVAVGQWARSGIALYGASPNFPENSAVEWGLLPVMSLHSRVIAIQQLEAGDAVGYNSTWIAPGPSRIAVVACGYADGYPRHAAHGTPVLVNGERTNLVGRVSMDMLTVDVTYLPHATVGSKVLLWGQDDMMDADLNAAHGADSGRKTVVSLPVELVAQHAQTNAYELLTAVAPRVPFSVVA